MIESLSYLFILADVGAGAANLGQRTTRWAEAAAEARPIIIVIGVALVIGIAFWLLIRYRERKNAPGYADSDELFGELCEAHGIAISDRQLLNEIAQAEQFDEPALLFLSPECLELSRLPAQFGSKREEIALLRAKLFGKVVVSGK